MAAEEVESVGVRNFSPRVLVPAPLLLSYVAGLGISLCGMVTLFTLLSSPDGSEISM